VIADRGAHVVVNLAERRPVDPVEAGRARSMAVHPSQPAPAAAPYDWAAEPGVRPPLTDLERDLAASFLTVAARHLPSPQLVAELVAALRGEVDR
jgi:hypothetical protein